MPVPHPPAGGKRGRPRLGGYKLQCVITDQTLDELVRLETSTGVYRTRLAAALLAERLGVPAPTDALRQKLKGNAQ
jgi:hypothetical protein